MAIKDFRVKNGLTVAGNITTTGDIVTTGSITSSSGSLGAGDMLSSVFDPTGKSQDIFAYADAAGSTNALTLQGESLPNFVLKNTPSTIQYPLPGDAMIMNNGIKINQNGQTAGGAFLDVSVDGAIGTTIKAGIIGLKGQLDFIEEYYSGIATPYFSISVDHITAAGTLTVGNNSAFLLAKDPVGNLEAATKQYVDASSPSGVEFTANKNAINGYAGLSATGLLDPTQLPPLSITSTYSVASEVAQLALVVQEGDVAVRTDLTKSFIALNAVNATIADWQELLTPTDTVLSVAGKTGIVSLASTDLTDTASILLTDSAITFGAIGTQIRTSNAAGSTAILVSDNVGIDLELRGTSANANQIVLSADTNIVGIGKLPIAGRTLDVAGSIYQNNNQVIDTAGGQVISNSLDINPTLAGQWSMSGWDGTTNPDIFATLGGVGSASGGLLTGPANSHFTIALRDNDVADSFSVIGTGTSFGTNNNYDALLFKVSADGNAYLGANDILHSGGGQTINGSIAITGEVLANNLNWDTITAVGTYVVNTTAATNSPSDGLGLNYHLTVISASGSSHKHQRAIRHENGVTREFTRSWNTTAAPQWTVWGETVSTVNNITRTGQLSVGGGDGLNEGGQLNIDQSTNSGQPSSYIDVWGSTVTNSRIRMVQNSDGLGISILNFVAPSATSVDVIHSGGGQSIATGLTINGTLYNFTGGHRGLSDATFVGTLGDIIVDDIFVANNSISDAIFYNKTSSAPLQKTAIGVLVDTPVTVNFDPNANTYEGVPGALRSLTDIEIQSVLTDYKVIGFNAVGEGMINVIGENGDIQAGDYIVTSNTTGKGMKQNDDIYRNYTVAKARESVTFTGTGDVQQIACVYLCG